MGWYCAFLALLFRVLGLLMMVSLCLLMLFCVASGCGFSDFLWFCFLWVVLPRILLSVFSGALVGVSDAKVLLWFMLVFRVTSGWGGLPAFRVRYGGKVFEWWFWLCLSCLVVVFVGLGGIVVAVTFGC